MNPLTQRIVNVLAVADMLGSNDTQLGDAIEMVSVFLDTFEDDDLDVMAESLVAAITNSSLRFDHPSAIAILGDVMRAINEFETEMT